MRGDVGTQWAIPILYGHDTDRGRLFREIIQRFRAPIEESWHGRIRVAYKPPGMAASRDGETIKVASLPRLGACGIIPKPIPAITRDYVLVRIAAASMGNEYTACQSGGFREVRSRP